MKNSDSLLINNVDLYALFADNEMSDAQFDTIKALLKENEGARNYYYRMVNLEVLLRDSKGLGEGFEGLPDSRDMDFWHVLAQHEKSAPAIEIERPEEVIERQLIQKVEYKRTPPRTINRFTLATAVLSAAALLPVIHNLGSLSSLTIQTSERVLQKQPLRGCWTLIILPIKLLSWL